MSIFDPMVNTYRMMDQVSQMTGGSLDADSLETGNAETDAMIAQLMAAAGQESAGATAEPMSIAETLIGSAMDVTGRRGMTGKDFGGTLPAWAQPIIKQNPGLLDDPDWDPYFGIVSQQGDERVYVGTGTTATRVPTNDPDVDITHETGQGVSSTPVGRIQRKYGDSITGETRDVPTGMPEAEELKRNRLEYETAKQSKPKKRKTKSDETLTTQQAMNLPYTWDNEEVYEAMARMRAAGINVTSFDGESGLLAAWGSLVNRAAMTYAMSEGSRKVTPWDVLDMYKAESQAAGNFTNYENGRKVTTQRSVSDVTEGQAWASLQTSLSQMLGRDPSDQELRDFTYRMNTLAAENPAISKTITRFKGGEAVSSDTKTTGGFTEADLAQQAYDDAQADPEYAETQAGITYFNAAMSALGPMGGGSVG